jgi:hypothetical protein
MQGPNKTGGWSSTIPMVTGDPSVTAPVQANMPFAGYKTIQFGVIAPTAAGSNGVFAATATISWTVEGNKNQRKVTVGNGISVSAPGQAFNVAVQDNTPSHLGLTLGAPYIVNVNFTPGSRPSQNQPAILNGGILILAPSQFHEIDVPQDAGVISIELVPSNLGTTDPAPAPNLQVEFEGATGQLLKRETIDTNAYQGFLPVPAGVVKIIVTNNSGTFTTDVSWNWGIDG